MATPPWTLPDVFASPIPIHRLSTELDRDGGRGSTAASLGPSTIHPSKEKRMPGLGGRMSTVIKAKISKLLDRAEDPAETLDYGYQKQREMLLNVKKGIADVVTAKKRLQMQSKKLQDSVVKLDTQARQALSQGREDPAR